MVFKTCYCQTCFFILCISFVKNIFGILACQDSPINEECEGKEDGRYPVKDCFKFMICTNGSKREETCAEDTMYAPIKGQCTPKSNVTLESFCEGRSTGDWMNPWNCHKFISCVLGWFTEQSCIDDLAYDAATDTCKNESQVLFCQVIASMNVNVTARLSNTSNNSEVMSLMQGNNTEWQPATSASQHKQLEHQNVAEPENKCNGTNLQNGAEVSAVNQTDINNNNNQTLHQSDSDLISPADLRKLLKTGDVRLIDVRMAFELKTEGRIAHSVNIPLPEIDSAFGMSNEEFKSKYNVDKPATTDCNLVFHCKSGVRSLKALNIAKTKGYTCAKSLTGGFEAWKVDSAK